MENTTRYSCKSDAKRAIREALTGYTDSFDLEGIFDEAIETHRDDATGQLHFTVADDLWDIVARHDISEN